MSNNPFNDPSSHSTTTTGRPTSSFVQPNEPPPNYQTATGGSTAPTTSSSAAYGTGSNAHPASSSSTAATVGGDQTLHVPGHKRTASHEDHSDAETYSEAGSEIDDDERRAMQDAYRELPKGWRREWDANSKHWFYVDTNATPPRSIWVHPYDDPQYLQSLPESAPPRQAYESNKDGKGHSGVGAAVPEEREQPGGMQPGKGPEKKTFGRKLKDKMTGTTHDERVKQRRLRAEQEKRQYEAYLKQRQAIIEAQRNGQYQPVYAPPPGGYYRQQPYGASPYGYPGGAYGAGPYNRGYGYGRSGFGGAGLGMGAGLLGGLLIGDMLF